MIFALSEDARDAVVEVIARLVDAGKGSGKIELIGRNGAVLATLWFSNPSAGAPRSGTLKFSIIREDPRAAASGEAVTARISDGSGNEVFECDVGPEGSDAVIKMNTNQIVAGGPVRIESFTLTMP